MKTKLFIFIPLLFLFFACGESAVDGGGEGGSAVFGGSDYFEGTITYSISMSGDSMMQTMAAMMPQEMEYSFLNKDASFQMKGGGMSSMMGRFLIKDGGNEVYRVLDAQKKAEKMPEGAADTNLDDSNFKVEKGSETKEIQGYTCQLYTVRMNFDEADATFGHRSHFWVTNKINIPDMGSKGLAGTQFGTAFLDAYGIKGFPLKIEMQSEIADADMKMVFEATKVDKTKPNAKGFEVPKDFTVQ